MTGRSASERNAMEITFTPWPSSGMILFCSPICGWPSTPNIIAMLGPKTSASIRPTEAPETLSERARLIAVVDFPTPPLPLAPATIFFTPGRVGPPPGFAWRVCAVISTSTSSTPGIPETFVKHSIFSCSFTGQAGVVSSTLKETFEPSMTRSLMKPRLTMSRFRSGSWTVPRISNTASSLRISLDMTLSLVNWLLMRMLGLPNDFPHKPPPARPVLADRHSEPIKYAALF